jgi:transcriptional regulator with GAF, ATPase, and Fis domain
LADGGTILLDEVGEIPFDSQAKLLRVLQEGEFERVGEDRTRRVNVRVISATSRDLKKEIAAGRFRQDLYYRLNIFPIEIPPLRERLNDIPLLVEHFIKQARHKLKVKCGDVTADQVRALQAYDWPGNIRELQNVIERAVIISQGGLLRTDLMLGNSMMLKNHIFESTVTAQLSGSFAGLRHDELKRRERDNILLALESAGWKIYGPGGAAELLGLKPTTLAARMKVMGIQRQTAFKSVGAAD